MGERTEEAERADGLAGLVPVRLDQGGTLEFRAMGGRKTFGPVPSEVWSMASPKGGQAFATMDVTPGRKRAGARKIADTLTPAVVDELVDAAPFEDAEMRERIRDALKARVVWMGAYAGGLVEEPGPLEGDAARAELAAGQAGLKLFPEQQAAVDVWRDGWDAVVNDHLRTGAPKEAAAKEVKFAIKELDSLTGHVRTPTDVYAWFALPGPAEGAPGLVGKVLTDKGYLVASLDEGAARAQAERSGGTVVKVLIPGGSPALYLPGIAEGAQGDLVVKRGARLRVVRVSEGAVEAALI